MWFYQGQKFSEAVMTFLNVLFSEENPKQSCNGLKHPCFIVHKETLVTKLQIMGLFMHFKRQLTGKKVNWYLKSTYFCKIPFVVKMGEYPANLYAVGEQIFAHIYIFKISLPDRRQDSTWWIFVVLPAQLAMDDDVIDLCDVKVRHGLPHDVIPSLLCKGTGSETFWIVLYGSLPYTVFLYKLVL